MYNPICQENGATGTYCTMHNILDTKSQNKHCVSQVCSSDQTLSPNCKCAYPYKGTLTFRAPSGFEWRNATSVEEDLLNVFQSNHLPVDSVSLFSTTQDPFQCFDFTIQIFPSGQDHFNQQDISSISSLLGNLSTIRPYTFIPEGKLTILLFFFLLNMFLVLANMFFILVPIII